MPKTVQSALFLLILMLTVIFARPGFGLNSVPVSSTSEVSSPAENLDPRFWLADTLDLQAELSAQHTTLNEWIQSINRSNLEFLCLGEIHNQTFRQFLAQEIFSQLDVDVLMLEADPPQVEQFLTQLEAGVASVSLFGSDIAAVIRAVQIRNPSVQILGVDETAQQTAWKNLEEVQSERQRLSRDGFIAQNIREQFRPGLRHVALFGGSHCSLYDVGLGNSRPFFSHLAGVLTAREGMKSALLVSAAQTNLFALTMRKVGLDDRVIVFPDTKAIAPTSYNFRWDLKSFLGQLRRVDSLFWSLGEAIARKNLSLVAIKQYSKKLRIASSKITRGTMALKLHVPSIDSPDSANQLKETLLTSEPDADIEVNAETKIVTVNSQASEETFKQLITAAGHTLA